MSSHLESDEAFARQLQAQELGLRSLPENYNAQTPLIRENNENPTLINARLSELSSARVTVAAIFVILAALVILSLHWNDSNPCQDINRSRWKWWSALSAIRMAMYTGLVCFMHIFKGWLDSRPSLLSKVTSARNVVDAVGLIWFVVGNMWIFGDDSCDSAFKSPVYDLCVAMLIVNYIQICLPCIVAILLIPVFCFCMPCLIRILARMQDAQAPKGATEDAIEAIPLVTVKADTLPGGGDSTCPICLNDMAVGEKVRVMPCKHVFHSQCVDEWLRVNASCPTCRMSIFHNDLENGASGEEKNDCGEEEKSSGAITRNMQRLTPFDGTEARTLHS